MLRESSDQPVRVKKHGNHRMMDLFVSLVGFTSVSLPLLFFVISTRTQPPRSIPESDGLDKNNTPTLASLSAIVQSKLLNMQQEAPCTGPTILCGHHDHCGLGCQIHHRMACLAISYATGFPLIHNEVHGWPYKKKWKDAFEQLGSNCKINHETIRVSWQNKGPFMSNGSANRIAYPLKHGFVVPSKIGIEVAKLHENPFIWWAGQFAKFTMRLTESQAQRVKEEKIRIGFGETGHADFGVHIRRTDKQKEDKYIDIATYFWEVEMLKENFSHRFDTKNRTQTIFLASDDHKVLRLARQAFPRETIIGFAANKTLKRQTTRRAYLDGAIRDIVLLSEADFVVCTLSSNFCRVVLELMSTRFPDASRRLKSVDENYSYQIWGHAIPIKVIYKY